MERTASAPWAGDKGLKLKKMTSILAMIVPIAAIYLLATVYPNAGKIDGEIIMAIILAALYKEKLSQTLILNTIQQVRLHHDSFPVPVSSQVVTGWNIRIHLDIKESNLWVYSRWQRHLRQGVTRYIARQSCYCKSKLNYLTTVENLSRSWFSIERNTKTTLIKTIPNGTITDPMGGRESTFTRSRYTFW